MAALGCLPPTVEPRATEHIEEMKTLIERLVASGNAYVAEDHVLFSVPSMPDYGKLSKRSLDEMIAGARVDVAPYKRDDDGFRAVEALEGRRAGWPSPSGIATPGRPGWHIECSAMSWKHLGETFDIHGGGIDLVFPHHENEIAQSRCAFHTPVMAKIWMHNGFLQVEGEKMSKSLGNFVTIREVLADWQGDVVRLAMLPTHYRQPIDWTVKGLEEAEKALASFFDAASADAERVRRRACSKRWPTTSTRRKRSPRCTAAQRRGRKALAGTLAFFGFRASVLGMARRARRLRLGAGGNRPPHRGAARCAQGEELRGSRPHPRRARRAGRVLKDSKDGTTWELAR